MKTFAFKATIIVEQDEPNIKQAIEDMDKGLFDIFTTDEFTSEPVIFLSPKDRPKEEPNGITPENITL